MSTPILVHFDFDRQRIVETDSSDDVTAGVISQHGADGILCPVAYFWKKLTAAEADYGI